MHFLARAVSRNDGADEAFLIIISYYFNSNKSV